MDMTDPFAAGPTVRPDLVVIGAPTEAPPTGREVHYTCSELLAWEPEVGYEPTTFRLRVGFSASDQTAPDGSSLLTLDASSVLMAPDGYRRIVWMIKWMIKAHPTENRMPRRALGYASFP
jgi:hypothetical protein